MIAMDLIKAILDGIKTSSFFYSKYYGNIQYRPISTKEVDDVFNKVLPGHGEEAVRFVTNYRTTGKEDPVDIMSTILEINEMRVAMNRWTVYHGVKDFQPEDWRLLYDGIPLGVRALSDPRCFLEVDKLAVAIMRLSNAPRESMKSVLTSEAGEQLGEAYWNLDYPLVERLGDLTDIQLSFIVESYDVLERKRKSEKHDDVKEALEHYHMKPIITNYNEAQLDIIRKLEEAKKQLGGES
jgi:hypothetical protein